MRDVAEEYQVKYTTLHRLWYRYANETINTHHQKYPSHIGIDEISVTSGHCYHTVLTDLTAHRVNEKTEKVLLFSNDLHKTI